MPEQSNGDSNISVSENYFEENYFEVGLCRSYPDSVMPCFQ